ncbi:MAG: TolC family protein [Planctomycetes bacterium]|nr:TolC family protein [Planctomycetota bacterium]
MTLAVLLSGCTPAQYARQADKAAYGLIQDKQAVALGEQRPFTIDYARADVGAVEGRSRLLLRGEPLPAGDEPVRLLSLSECLELASLASADFQDEKETLYIEALALANQRHDWAGFFGALTGTVSHDKIQDGPEINAASGAFEVGFAQRLAQGGLLTLGAGLTVLSDLTGIHNTEFGSFLTAELAQPLWRGAWRGFAYEDLYRAERDLAISVLEYERFTQTFSTRITSDFYQVLQDLDTLKNEEDNIVRLEQALRRTQVQVEGGQASRIEQDQTEKNLLDAQVRLARLRQQYQSRLDRFKITMGISTAFNVAPDPAELAALTRRGPAPIPMVDEQALAAIAEQAAAEAAARYDAEHPGAAGDPVGREAREAFIRRWRDQAYHDALEAQVAHAAYQAVDIALHARPEVLRGRVAVRDAGRNVLIVADRFNPRVDLALGIGASGTRPNEPFRVQFHRNERFAELLLDYSLDQTDNRDAYRLALIAESRELRRYNTLIDDTRLDVIDNYRELIRARQTYDLQQRNVAVAERRQRLAALEQAAGEASARDVLEAEEGLRDAQNGLTEALVAYETTRIEFLASLGLLDVDAEGQYHERETAMRFTRLSDYYGSIDIESSEEGAAFRP